MSELPNRQDTSATALSIRQAIGLESPEGSDWSLIHGRQYALLRERVRARAILHITGFILIAAGLFSSVNTLVIVAWAGALLAAVVFSARADMRLADAESRYVAVAEMKSHAFAAAAKGAVWS
ncbi:MAG: hypothetical protein VX540_02495, partial [Pseudomonadota bacterium]|nr:hypothetical protein [Pseudomonadota bacterium]